MTTTGFKRFRPVPVYVSSTQRKVDFPDADSYRYTGIVIAMMNDFFPHNKDWEVRVIYYNKKPRKYKFENMETAHLFASRCLSCGHACGVKGFGVFSNGVKLSMCSIDNVTGQTRVTVLDELDGLLLKELMTLYKRGNMDFLDPPINQDKKKYRMK